MVWSDEARRKAAEARKRKSNTVRGGLGHRKIEKRKVIGGDIAKPTVVTKHWVTRGKGFAPTNNGSGVMHKLSPEQAKSKRR